MAARYKTAHCIVTVLLALQPLQTLMAEQTRYILDDRSIETINTSNGEHWRLFTDGVMGGISQGQLAMDVINDHKCLRMRGDVKLDNNGGFVQMALNLPADVIDDISSYSGLVLEVYGNDESYNVHLRTANMWLPWQSYRHSFIAPSEWTTLQIPFSEFKPYRFSKPLNISKLKRVGLVAIGREFSADLCVGKIGLYR